MFKKFSILMIVLVFLSALLLGTAYCQEEGVSTESQEVEVYQEFGEDQNESDYSEIIENGENEYTDTAGEQPVFEEPTEDPVYEEPTEETIYEEPTEEPVEITTEEPTEEPVPAWEGISEDQLWILSSIYDQMTGIGKAYSGWFTEGDTYPCGWSGVSCDEYGNVTALSFANAGYFSVFPESILSLRELKELSMVDTLVRGPLPENLFSSLPKLEKLELTGNLFSGPIPSLPYAFEVYPMLREITLSDNLEDDRKTQMLYSPEYSETVNYYLDPYAYPGIDLTPGLDGEIPDDWNRLPLLYKIDLSGNSLQGSVPESFGDLQLQSLDLSNNTGELQISRELYDRLSGIGSYEINLSGLSVPAEPEPEPLDEPVIEDPIYEEPTEEPYNEPEPYVPENPVYEEPTEEPYYEQEPYVLENPVYEEPTEEPYYEPEPYVPENPVYEAPTEVPWIEIPTEEPQIFVPTEEPLVVYPTEVPQVIIPTEIPQIIIPTEVPQVIIPTEVPQVIVPTDVPQVVIPTEVPQNIIPTNVPQVIIPTDVPQVTVPTAVPTQVPPTPQTIYVVVTATPSAQQWYTATPYTYTYSTAQPYYYPTATPYTYQQPYYVYPTATPYTYYNPNWVYPTATSSYSYPQYVQNQSPTQIPSIMPTEDQAALLGFTYKLEAMTENNIPMTWRYTGMTEYSINYLDASGNLYPAFAMEWTPAADLCNASACNVSVSVPEELLNQGKFSLQLRTRDAVGRTYVSDPVEMEVSISQPEPTPTPEPEQPKSFLAGFFEWLFGPIIRLFGGGK